MEEAVLKVSKSCCDIPKPVLFSARRCLALSICALWALSCCLVSAIRSLKDIDFFISAPCDMVELRKSIAVGLLECCRMPPPKGSSTAQSTTMRLRVLGALRREMFLPLSPLSIPSNTLPGDRASSLVVCLRSGDNGIWIAVDDLDLATVL